MKVLLLGGDGYLGWPTAMNLSRHGHDVTIVDNYLRRRLCNEINVKPLIRVPNLNERVQKWYGLSKKRITVFIGDLLEWDFISEVFKAVKPDAIIHYAEQPSAPYSMMDRRAAVLTLKNNLGVTMNVLLAVKEHSPKAHIVKIGTMGEYGTPNIDIEEGWLEIEHNDRKDSFLYPRQAGSLYHTTKIMDTDLMWFYVRTWGLSVTDLMQGPVYGLVTPEVDDETSLYTYFNYDEVFGTVLNRFLVQAITGHPLTVYGKGGQTRGYLNIIDTLNCVRLTVENPAKEGELRILNQFTETFTVLELAHKVKSAGKHIGIEVEIQSVRNPRVESESHYYNPIHQGLIKLGLKPHLLTEDVLIQLLQTVSQFKDNIDKDKIVCSINWK